MERSVCRIIATTDVHSALDRAVPLMTHLDRRRADSLIVDCGDWFEGTGYYQIGAGNYERAIMTQLYDVLAPGNHGWKHHLNDSDLHRITVCANVTDHTGSSLFRPLHRVTVGGRHVGVTAVIGEEAFDAIRVEQRAGHHLIDPARALTDLIRAHRDIASWILLSHSGIERDQRLAAEVADLDVIFAGHCDRDGYGPAHTAGTMIVKGRDHAAGYAMAEPTGQGWQASRHPFPAADSLPPRLEPLGEQLRSVQAQLAAPLGPIVPAYRCTTPDRHTLLVDTADRLREEFDLPVLLSDTTLRPGPLGEHLLLADLLALEPFTNHLVITDEPAARTTADDWRAWLEHISDPDLAGPLVCSPEPSSRAPARLLTTDYLTHTFLGGSSRPAGLLVREAVCIALLTSTRQP
jgi:5'-nucleotidase / UDP-sugar diphosphatase